MFVVLLIAGITPVFATQWQAIQQVAGEVLVSLDQIIIPTGSPRTWVENQYELRKQLQMYEKKTRELDASLALLKNVEKENELLRTAFASSSAQRSDWVPAYIVSASPYPIVLAGSNEGIEKGAVIVNATHSLVGKVEAVHPHYATIISVQDIKGRWGVVHQRSSAKGVLSNTTGGPEVEFFDLISDMQHDDALVTIGQEKIPPGIPVGKIVQIKTRLSDPATRAGVSLFMSEHDSLVFVYKERQ